MRTRRTLGQIFARVHLTVHHMLMAIHLFFSICTISVEYILHSLDTESND
jgi:hypothetical protein